MIFALSVTAWGDFFMVVNDKIIKNSGSLANAQIDFWMRKQPKINLVKGH